MQFLLDGLHEDLNRVLVKPYVGEVDSAGRTEQVNSLYDSPFTYLSLSSLSLSLPYLFLFPISFSIPLCVPLTLPPPLPFSLLPLL